jgi:predicted DsbA family dithiol-disulfide isomerase/uncharacterized membrane protein
LVVRLSAIGALAVSTALASDYLSPTAAFCAEGSGCRAVRASAWAEVALLGLRVPMPLFGVFGFAVLLAATLWPGSRRAAYTKGAAWVAGVAALGLLAIQAWVIGQFCVLCVAVDGLSLVAALAACFLGSSSSPLSAEPELGGYTLRPWAWALVALSAAALTALWPSVRRQLPVPAGVSRLYSSSQVTIVKFVDFECPHCRRLHARLEPILARYGEKVGVVERHVPLASHRNAEGAARAAICADEQPGGRALADAMYELHSLEAPRILSAAGHLGLDQAALSACLKSPATTARLAEDLALYRSLGIRGLPTVYIGAERFVGVASEEAYMDAIERALRGEGARGVGLGVYLALGALWCSLLLWGGKRESRVALSH